MPDGEAWICWYDGTLQDFYWEPDTPQPPQPEPTPVDGVVFKRVAVPQPDGLTAVIMSRAEWINHIIYTGAFSCERLRHLCHGTDRHARE